jgi:glycosyltransferase involved in cell wall biosynthesis
MPHADSQTPGMLAVVAIGRNEGERLQRCLSSLIHGAELVVYVDSGSTDGSCEFARDIGAHVVNLDMSRPFSAARARNAGFAAIQALRPDIRYVQFIDGDCEIVPGWMHIARAFLETHPTAAAACGRLRERHPEASVYNWLCDLEWNTPIGLAKSCGGIVLMRAAALSQSGGYREDVIAGEEPELCVRLRGLGWLIWRIDCDMAWHDAAMTRFSQWWMRAVRSGYAFALGSHLHGASPERHWVWESRRAVLWGGVIPACLAGLALAWSPWALMGLLLYPVQTLRLARRSPLAGRAALTDATFKTFSKFAEMQGTYRFWKDRMSHRPPRIIEYK